MPLDSFRKLLSTPHSPTGKVLRFRPVRFLVFGLPLAAICFASNAFFVQVLNLYKPLAYALVLLIQVTLGYTLNRIFVFYDVVGDSPQLIMMSLYVTANLSLRITDWAVYSLQVEFWGVPYLLAQLINMVAFLLIKYVVYERIFGRGKRALNS